MKNKKVLYNTFSTLILQFVVLLYGFIVPKLIIESFGSSVNGLILSISQFLSYIALLESGIGPIVKAALYKPIVNKNENEIKDILKASDRFFKKLSFIFIIYLIILSIVYPIIVSSEFGYIYTLSLIVVISISTFFEYFFGITYKLYLHAEQKTYVSSIIQLILYIANIIIILILVKLNVNIHIIKLISGFIFVLRPIIQNIYVKKKYNINLKDANKDYKLDKKWDGLAQHIAAIIHNGTDVVVLTLFASLIEVSIYSVYNMVVRGIRAIIQAFIDGVEAYFGSMVAKDDNASLNYSFNLYEVIYYTVITFIYSCTLILIVPFVSVYTLGVTDANYIQPVFAILFVISELVYALMLPYNYLTLSAGHFKETKKGAYVQAILNVSLSILLVFKFGLSGVIVATLTATTIRTIEFIYHTNKYILKRTIFNNLSKILVSIFEICLVVFVVNIIPDFITVNSYLTWIYYAILTAFISILVVFPINLCIYKNEFKFVLGIIKRK